MTMTRTEARERSWLGNQTIAGVINTPTALPLDLVAGAVVAYATRRIRAAYSGACMRVRRSSDNAEADIGFDADGGLDQTALAAHVGANSGYVVTWYDQTTAGLHATQATTSKQPRIVNAGVLDTLNGRPAPLFDGSNDVLASAALGSTATDWTMLGVLNHVTYPGSNNIPLSIGGSAVNGRTRSLWKTSTDAVLKFSGYNFNYTTSSLSWGGTTAGLYMASNSGSTVTVGKDGLTTSGAASGTLVPLISSNYVGLGLNISDGVSYANCKISEVLIYASALAAPDREALEDALAWHHNTPLTPRGINTRGLKRL